MLRTLYNAITGRSRHWDNTFNVVNNTIRHKAEELPDPLNIFMNHFIDSTGYFIELIMNMSSHESQNVIRIDCRHLSKEKFNVIFSIILSFFVFIFSTMNKWIKDDLLQALHEVTENPDVTNQTIQLLAKHYSKSKGQPQLQILSGKIWDKFADLTQYQKNKYPDKTAFFMLTLSNIYVDTVRNIKEKTKTETNVV